MCGRVGQPTAEAHGGQGGKGAPGGQPHIDAPQDDGRQQAKQKDAPQQPPFLCAGRIDPVRLRGPIGQIALAAGGLEPRLGIRRRRSERHPDLR